MNKRIKKKYRDLQLTDICDHFVETIPLQDHTAVIVKLNPADVYSKGKAYRDHIKWVMDKLKRDHDIDMLVTDHNAEIVATTLKLIDICTKIQQEAE